MTHPKPPPAPVRRAATLRRRRPAWVRGGTLLAVAAVVVATLTSGTSTLGAAASVPAPRPALVATDQSHPYAAPRWYPLRTDAKVSCSYKNCKGDTYHPYWAIDFRGAKGDEVHPAGSGVFHVGNVDYRCLPADATSREGTWVWVDHGGGVVTRYNHFATLKAREGDLVTPATVLGTLGHQGVSPCSTYYLHFEVRVGGIKGTRVNPGQLLACVDGDQVALPRSKGYASWRDMPAPTGAVTVSSQGDGCAHPRAATPARPTGVHGVRASHRATLTWATPPTGLDAITVTFEEFHPSTGRYGYPTYRTVSPTARRTTFRKLRNGRPYRLRVSFHNATGASAWGPRTVVTPAGPPSVPQRRSLVSDHRALRHVWTRSKPDGTPVTGYRASRRCRVGGSWQAWTHATVAADVRSRTWRGLKPGRTCQVTVTARSRVGSSARSPLGAVRIRR